MVTAARPRVCMIELTTPANFPASENTVTATKLLGCTLGLMTPATCPAWSRVVARPRETAVVKAHGLSREVAVHLQSRCSDEFSLTVAYLHYRYVLDAQDTRSWSLPPIPRGGMIDTMTAANFPAWARVVARPRQTAVMKAEGTHCSRHPSSLSQYKKQLLLRSAHSIPGNGCFTSVTINHQHLWKRSCCSLSFLNDRLGSCRKLQQCHPRRKRESRQRHRP